MKTARAKLAADALGFRRTSDSLRSLHSALERFKEISEPERNILAYDIDDGIKRAGRAFAFEAQNCDEALGSRLSERMEKTFMLSAAVSVLSLATLTLSFLHAAARNSGAAFAANAVITIITLCFCHLVLPALQLRIFDKMVRENARAINDALAECRKLLGPYEPGATPAR